MKGLTISQRINLSFALIVLIIVISGALFFQNGNDNEENITNIEKYDIAGSNLARELRISITDHWLHTIDVMHERQVAAAAQSNAEQAKVQEIIRLEQHIKELYTGYQATITLDEDQNQYRILQQQLNDYFSASQSFLKGISSNQPADLQSILDGQQKVWITSRATLDQMVQLNTGNFQRAVLQLHKNISQNKTTVIVCILLSVLLATACGALLRRSILTPVNTILAAMQKIGEGNLSIQLKQQHNDEFGLILQGFNQMTTSLRDLVYQTQSSAVQLVTAITEIAATSKQQQATVTETAATTTEIGATTKQIVSTSKELVSTVSEVTDTAEYTASLAEASQSSVKGMDEVMRHLSAAAELVSNKLALLSERASGINQVTITIVKVADQTNLLSLNAAIEAEKAGEYGKGFAVVANEIRRLADQTAIATFDIEQMVREIQSAVAAGVMGIDKFAEEVRRGSADMIQVSEQLSQIIEHVQDLAPRIQLVNEGMQTQAINAEQIDQALSQLSDASSQTVQSLVQTSSAIDNMNEVANGLRLGVNRFQV
ncbi:methyl-accepting chemotaxis protein [Rheinheimera riviphila]|uniref:Methyl-accepting chemotaxis protein n=1 Tax=Rheinheimera riviphila TaxID=1834037 RepID=A0A437R1H3_9GAMM|nr:methyl-accepting chemotaxis protein [Rheinheimera riviphila]RVU40580.1 methyl-accepting chemotaxis protein [Rheinheimera riviphila]